VHYYVSTLDSFQNGIPRGSGGKRVSMECDICRTLAQQLRSYEMEIEDARNRSLPHDDALEQSRKTSVLYQHHREAFHKACSRPAVQSAAKAADVPGSLIPKAELMHATPFWPDDLSELSNQAVLNFMAENRAWNKRLREGTAELVNTRLANTITKEEYVSRRTQTNKDGAECYRRAVMLVRDLAVRERGLLPFIDSGYLPN
jgi:hypothetical protein